MRVAFLLDKKQFAKSLDFAVSSLRCECGALLHEFGINFVYSCE